MSELKAHNINDLSLHDIVNCEFYLKSEADKVIAEKDKEIVELKGQVNGFKNRSNLWHYNAVEEHKKFVQVDQQITELKEKHKTEVKELLCIIRDKENNFNRAFDSEEKEIRHHKYKRCLAMAKWCHNQREIYERDSYNWELEDDAVNSLRNKANIMRKWRKRWLKIAELEKENAELRKENESLKYSVATLDTDLAMATRWRKCSEELPEDGETVLVLLGRTPKTRGFFLTSRYVAGGWTYGEDPQGCKPTHWFRIPKAPEVKK